MMGRCRLCQRRTSLQHSHIISNFVLRDARGSDPKPLERFTSQDLPRPHRHQSWDQEYLFCSDCENRRRHWEAIVAATIAGRGDGREPRPELCFDPKYPSDLICAKNFRYGEIKLWILSTLFSMHHATKIDWTAFKLTSDEEHRLRNRLLSGCPGSDLDFQIFGRVTIRSSRESRERGGIIAPGYITESRRGLIRTRIGQFWALDCQWAVFLGDWPDNPMRGARLREDGTWRLLWDSEDATMTLAARMLGLIQ